MLTMSGEGEVKPPGVTAVGWIKENLAKQMKLLWDLEVAMVHKDFKDGADIQTKCRSPPSHSSFAHTLGKTSGWESCTEGIMENQPRGFDLAQCEGRGFHLSACIALVGSTAHHHRHHDSIFRQLSCRSAISDARFSSIHPSIFTFSG